MQTSFKLMISKSFYAREWLAMKVDELKNYTRHYLGGLNYTFDESNNDYIIYFNNVDNVAIGRANENKAILVWNKGKLAVAMDMSLGYDAPYMRVINLHD
jgi:hypothetical protein